MIRDSRANSFKIQAADCTIATLTRIYDWNIKWDIYRKQQIENVSIDSTFGSSSYYTSLLDFDEHNIIL